MTPHLRDVLLPLSLTACNQGDPASPTSDGLCAALDGTDAAVALVAAEALAEVRKHKTLAQRSLATPVIACTITVPADRLAFLEQALDDVTLGARATNITLVTGDQLSAQVELEAPAN